MWEAYQPCCLGLPQSFVCRGGVGCVVHVCAGLVLAVWIGLLPLCDLFVFPRCFWVLLPSAIAPAQPGNKSNRNDLIIWSGHCFSWFSNPSKSFSWIHFGRSFGLFGNIVFGLLLPEFFSMVFSLQHLDDGSSKITFGIPYLWETRLKTQSEIWYPPTLTWETC